MTNIDKDIGKYINDIFDIRAFLLRTLNGT